MKDTCHSKTRCQSSSPRCGDGVHADRIEICTFSNSRCALPLLDSQESGRRWRVRACKTRSGCAGSSRLQGQFPGSRGCDFCASFRTVARVWMRIKASETTMRIGAGMGKGGEREKLWSAKRQAGERERVESLLCGDWIGLATAYSTRGGTSSG